VCIRYGRQRLSIIISSATGRPKTTVGIMRMTFRLVSDRESDACTAWRVWPELGV
jgi:hypothetical protein